ncbi:PQQ-binding-like beta-propeller repeat protein [Micromonospora sp. RTGN7]|uniref:outer membrane protein assembly factor BamB family protein n=1 Tax=Micromonospora sp. RTGN7 TaxID=3016526 RepID=UPI0029FF0472|nr:PQQ-binding-like beta-propeller repeat protein [Micromonospora sp. RTGN7]
MTVIDLGELRGDVKPDPPSRPPRAAARPLRAALAGAVALFALAASAPSVRPASAVLAVRTGAEVLLAGGRLYVAEPPSLGTDGGREVVAYTMPAAAGGSPRPLWRTPAPGGFGQFWVREHNGFVLLTGGRDGRALETFVVDAATGRQRWRLPGFPDPTVGDGLLLLGGGFGDGAGEQATDTLQAVDLPSGRVRWSVPATRGRLTYRYRGAEVDRVVLIPGSGRIEVRDARSGAVLAALDPPPGGPPGPQDVNVAGDLLLVTSTTGDVAGDSRVTAYGLDALDRRWQLDLPPGGYLAQCGEVPCVAARNVGVSLLDPATGRARWTNPRSQWVAAVRGDRLLVAAQDLVGAVEFAVLDATTGRTVAELGRRELVHNRDPDGPLFTTRRTREGALLVAELDPVAAEARSLEVLPDAPVDCRSAGRDLVCRRASGTWGWWRLPG